MIYTSINSIVHEALLDNEYSNHWYIQFLNHGIQSLEQLHWDVLGNVESKVLSVSNTGIVKLPCDYIDLIRIGQPGYQQVRRLRNSDVNRLVNRDAVGNAIPYPDRDWLRYGNWDYPLHWCDGGFSILRERGEIQLTSQREGFIYIDYLGDGTCTSAATKVNPYAKYTIKAYIEWKRKKHSRTYNNQDVVLAKQEYIIERTKLVNRVDDTTIQDIWHTFNKPHSTSRR